MSLALADLPNLDSTYTLTDEQIENYRTNGHILLRGLCSPDEARIYREVILDATLKHNRETRPIEERDTYGKAFLQVMNLWTVDELVKKFVMSHRFANVAKQLMEVEGVRLYHDQALFKEPGGGYTPWHQDQFYWPLASDRTVTMWMPMIDVSAVMGSMTFANRSQENGFIPISAQISDVSEAFYDGYVLGKGYELTGGGAMAAGDATFHGGWTLHRAPGNVTQVTREVMTIIYYPDRTTISEPVNDFQRADHKTWLGGLPVGNVADGPINPVLA